jgi:hypothetical protein
VGDVDFHDWSSIGTHNQVCYFLDVALPELHSNCITAISFTTYYGMLFGSFTCQKKIDIKPHYLTITQFEAFDTSNNTALLYNVVCSEFARASQTPPQLSVTCQCCTKKVCKQYRVGNKALFVQPQLLG